MAVDVEIPGMGESVTEVILIEWLKADGEMLERDEPICVLETDKANVDLPAPASGVLRHVSAIDDVLEVGNVLARIDAGGEDVAAPAAELAAPEPFITTSDGLPSTGDGSSARPPWGWRRNRHTSARLPL